MYVLFKNWFIIYGKDNIWTNNHQMIYMGHWVSEKIFQTKKNTQNFTKIVMIVFPIIKLHTVWVTNKIYDNITNR